MERHASAELYDAPKARVSLSDIASELRRNTTLHTAARLGYEESVKKIIDRDPSLLNYPNEKGDNPLHVAARVGHLPIVKLLTEHSFQQFQQSSQTYSISRTSNDEGNRALHVALLSKHEEVALHLLDFDEVVVFDANKMRATPLHLAAGAGFVRVLNKILQIAGGGENIDGPSGQTPLHASENIEELTKKQDSDGKTALYYASATEGENSSEIVRLLLEVGASSADMRDNDGLSPLLVAAKTGNLEAVRAILQACPTSVEHSDYNGRNALHLALLDIDILAHDSNISFYKKLLEMEEMRTLKRRPDNEGDTPQLKATWFNLTLFIKQLLSVAGLERKAKKSRITKISRIPKMFILRMLVTSLYRWMTGLYKWVIWNQYGFSDRRKQAESSRNKDVKETMGGLSVVAGLLATVTFAAAFAIPGGYKADGSPLLLHKPALQVFLLSDAIAFSFSILAVMTATRRPTAAVFIRVLTSVDRAVGAAMIAFMFGLYAVISSELKWMAILICVIGYCIYFSAIIRRLTHFMKDCIVYYVLMVEKKRKKRKQTDDNPNGV